MYARENDDNYGRPLTGSEERHYQKSGPGALSSASPGVPGARVIFFPINAPGMGRFKLFNLVGYS